MKKWLIMALVMSLSSICLAQSKSPVRKEPPVPSSTIKKAQKKEHPVPVNPVTHEKQSAPIVKFSMDMIENDRLDPEYAGMPVAKLRTAIGKWESVKKGEFESTSDFNARKAAALSDKFLGDSSIEDTFAFVFRVASYQKFSNGLKYNFNADTSEVRLFVLPKTRKPKRISLPYYPYYEFSGSPSSEMDELDIDAKVDSASTYQGSNAYGAMANVDKSWITKLGILANPIPFLNSKRASNYPNPVADAQFNLENTKAAKELPVLKALIIVKLIEPYGVFDIVRFSPTLDDPTDISVSSWYLTSDVLGIVFYSGLTGEIFARIPENFGKPEPKPKNP